MGRMRGQADLIDRDGVFYLAGVAAVPEPPPLPPHDWLGVDLGIVNLAADSDGQTDSGGHLNGRRQRQDRLCRRLQQKGTPSAKRLLKNRRRQHRWAFRQLRAFIQYKTKLAGVPVVWVDPRHTARTCPHCGQIAKRNRVHQSALWCVDGGFAGPAATIASGNIARRAAVNQPHAGFLIEIPASSAL